MLDTEVKLHFVGDYLQACQHCQVERNHSGWSDCQGHPGCRRQSFGLSPELCDSQALTLDHIANTCLQAFPKVKPRGHNQVWHHVGNLLDDQ